MGLLGVKVVNPVLTSRVSVFLGTLTNIMRPLRGFYSINFLVYGMFTDIGSRTIGSSIGPRFHGFYGFFSHLFEVRVPFKRLLEGIHLANVAISGASDLDVTIGV